MAAVAIDVIDNFDRELRLLFKQCTHAVNLRYGKIIAMGEVRDELEFLKNFIRAYDRTNNPEDFIEYFEQIYNANRRIILQTLVDDEWLAKRDIVVQYGEGITKITKRMKMTRILLSEIFEIALDVRKRAEEIVKGADDAMLQTMNDELIIPSTIMLHFMRIMYHINESADKPKLLAIVNTLEKELGADKTVDPNAPKAAGGVMTMMRGICENIGWKLPAGAENLKDEQVNEMMMKVASNPAIKNFISTLSQPVTDGPAAGMPDIAGGLSNLVKNPEVNDFLDRTGLNDLNVQTDDGRAPMSAMLSNFVSGEGGNKLNSVIGKIAEGFRDPALLESITGSLRPSEPAPEVVLARPQVITDASEYEVAPDY